MRVSTLIKIIASAALAGAAVSGLLAAVPAWSGWNLKPLALSQLVVGLHAGAGVALLAALERGKARRLMQLGMVLAVIAAVAWLALVWRVTAVRGDDGLLQGASTASGWCALIAMIGVALCQSGNRRLVRSARRAAVALLACLLVLWPMALWLPDASHNLGRALALVSALAITALMVNMVAARMAGPAGGPRTGAGTGAAARRVTIVCPRCAREQAIALDGAACQQCGLRVKVVIP